MNKKVASMDTQGMPYGWQMMREEDHTRYSVNVRLQKLVKLEHVSRRSPKKLLESSITVDDPLVCGVL